MPVSRTVQHTGRRDFFKVTVPLHSFRQELSPGQYQLPFSFVLPQGVPGCFKHADGSLT